MKRLVWAAAFAAISSSAMALELWQTAKIDKDCGLDVRMKAHRKFNIPYDQNLSPEAEAYVAAFLEGCSAGRLNAIVNSKEGKEAGVRQGCHQGAMYHVAHLLDMDTTSYADFSSKIPKAKWPLVEKLERKCL
ncbi:MAG: hypothetical protein WBZ54_12965, partial [Methylocella sp.]